MKPAVETGNHPDGEPTLDDGVLVDSNNLHWLITDAEDLSDPVQISEIDNQPGRVRYHHPDDPDVEGIGWTEYQYDQFRDARLCYGLRQTVGDYTVHASSAIPQPVAIAGKQAVSSYYRAEYMRSRDSVASTMGITPQTVSNHWTRMRWSPGDQE
ncbi:hypothetical protein [Halonotius pteroides]|nr:hypothetical protein [Halonotius pteroides]